MTQQYYNNALDSCDAFQNEILSGDSSGLVETADVDSSRGGNTEGLSAEDRYQSSAFARSDETMATYRTLTGQLKMH